MKQYTYTAIINGKRETKTVEADDPRDGWKLTQWPNEFKRSSSVELARKNSLVYDEARNTIGLRYVDEPEKLEGARIMHYEVSKKFLGITYNTQIHPVYFVLVSDVTRAYRRPKDITHSPEDFYQATQWTDLVHDIYKNTTPLLEKITTIIWAACGLLSLMVLFMLIFAKGV